MSPARPVRLGLFSPSPVLAHARRSGGLARAGLEVEVTRVASSVEQFRDLLAGRYDAVLTSPDNVLAYRYEPGNPLGRTADVRILAAVDRGVGLSLVAGGGCRTVADLAGARVGVDTPGSGFALALFAVLRRAGLTAGTDYEVLELGATPRRLERLLAGDCDATMLNAGFDLRAEAAGCRRLVRVGPELAPYLATVLATTGERLATDGPVIRRLPAVWAEAATELTGPDADDEVAGFARDELGLDPASAARYVETLRDPLEGLVADGRVDPAAVATLVRLRVERGGDAAGLEPALHPGSGLVDAPDGAG